MEGAWLVFSTYVEVILGNATLHWWYTSILHVCGGDPIWQSVLLWLAQYSPRMWRWSYPPWQAYGSYRVFSTYVEVILAVNLSQSCHIGILHVCGGDPDTRIIVSKLDLYSPRMWRWSQAQVVNSHPYSVFSTYVEVILFWRIVWKPKESILHVCGGDPYQAKHR